jgi:hypothetical protein
MQYPFKGTTEYGIGLDDVAVCNEECAEAAGIAIVDELADGWIAATDEATCPGCGRLLVLDGQLTGAHTDDHTADSTSRLTGSLP